MADAVTASNDEEGVAHALESLLIEQKAFGQRA